MSRYLVPKNTYRVELKVSNSRFITTIGPASSTKAAHDFIKRIREEMPDATHHVYAFKIGYGASVSEGLSDDGEPSGTSGPPALAVVRGSGVGDVVLVITRYFGGTKLGTGGLVAAYTQAAQQAFSALETEEKVTRLAFTMEIPYSLFEKVRILLDEYACVVKEPEYGSDVKIEYLIPEENADAFSGKIRDLTAGRSCPRLVEEG